MLRIPEPTWEAACKVSQGSVLGEQVMQQDNLVPHFSWVSTDNGPKETGFELLAQRKAPPPRGTHM